MTTIAYKNGVMAADSGSWMGDASHGWAEKLAKGPDGTLYGVAGGAPEAMGFLDWVRAGADAETMPRAEALPDGGSTFIVLAVSPNGPVRIFCAKGIETYQAPYFAIGAGSATAFGALWAGASAADAIEATKEHGSGAHGRVLTISHEG
jgi:ATP-dependent HslUV protease subunit HslV